MVYYFLVSFKWVRTRRFLSQDPQTNIIFKNKLSCYQKILFVQHGLFNDIQRILVSRELNDW